LLEGIPDMSDEKPDRMLALPGAPDAKTRRAAMIRVDHAGEYGAVRIYEGQLAVFGRQRGVSKTTQAIREMAAQEAAHLTRFDALMLDEKVRPTALRPLWDVAGFALGAVTALMGEKAAMACTAAVETVIEDHYAAQAKALGPEGAPLTETIQSFAADEAEHRRRALDAGAAQTPGYRLLSGAIKAGCRIAIKLSEKI
jgi:ubiquinone biosynthesis monooxygenase Coq7